MGVIVLVSVGSGVKVTVGVRVSVGGMTVNVAVETGIVEASSAVWVGEDDGPAVEMLHEMSSKTTSARNGRYLLFTP
jgi:hypothetical protein